MAKKIRVWDGTQWQDVAPSLPYTAIHSAQASMPLTGVDGQVWLDTDGTLAGQDFVPLSGGTMTGNLNVPSINSGGIAGQNFCINGNFDIFQRTSFSTSSAGYCLDRWYAWSNGGSMTITQQTSGAPIGSKYYMRVGYNALNVCNMWQFIEHDNVKMLQGRTVTLSAKIRRNAAFTPSYILGLYKTTTANAGTNASWSQVGSAAGINQNIPTGTSSNDWLTLSTTVTVPADGTAEGLAIVLFENAGAPSGAYIEISQVKLEIGSSATPITRAGNTIAGELATCQRYFERIGQTLYTPYGTGLCGSGTSARINVACQPKRITPTLAFGTTTSFQVWNSAYAGLTVTGIGTVAGSKANMNIGVTVNSGGLVAGNVTILIDDGSANSYIDFSAEL